MLLFHKLFISREINTNAPFQKSEEILFSEFYKDLFFFLPFATFVPNSFLFLPSLKTFFINNVVFNYTFS